VAELLVKWGFIDGPKIAEAFTKSEISQSFWWIFKTLQKAVKSSKKLQNSRTITLKAFLKILKKSLIFSENSEKSIQPENQKISDPVNSNWEKSPNQMSRRKFLVFKDSCQMLKSFSKLFLEKLLAFSEN
jgi:hypothetical protein